MNESRDLPKLSYLCGSKEKTTVYMFTIISKRQYSEKVFGFDIEAPLIARTRKAGHFVIIRTHQGGERIPLTIMDSDPVRGTISLVVQTVGLTTSRLCALEAGDALLDVVGPLGQATHIERFGTVLCAGGGVGIAPMLPIIRALKAAGNRVVSVLAGRSRELIILEDEVRSVSDEVIIMTDDGSYGQQGVVTVGMEQVIQREHVDKCFAIGPAIMMKFCCLLTQKYGIPTDVSLNTIMVDGTGMCGACRVSVGGRTRFVCVDGPEFDGHQVDWNGMMQRMGSFREEEQRAFEAYMNGTAPAAHPLPSSESKNAAASTKDSATASSSEGKDSAPVSSPSGEDSESGLLDRNAPWRQQLRATLKAKERTALERCPMNELDPVYRATTRTEEVNTGYTAQQAMGEARRCLDCANPTCMEGCPVAIEIPSFIKSVERGAFLDAARVIHHTSSLPAVCGRVCPQEKQCESRCIHVKMGGKAVAIGNLERFVADYERESGQSALPTMAPINGRKIAVVGSGPAGLAFAGDMAKNGYLVTVFEALHEIGGVLKYGIPEFRLPNRIVDVEIAGLERMGVTFVRDCIIGKTITVDDLRQQGFEGIFVATGAGLPNFMGIAGENSVGVMSSNEYLTRINLMDASNPAADTPIGTARRVIVVGGGNTAMDSCRTAKRLGAENVTIVYRRSEAEMPARLEEVKHAREEGIEFLTLHNPIEYIADERGRLQQVVLQQMELGEPDASGRRSPVPMTAVDGTPVTVTIPCDLAIVAVGVSPNPIVPQSVGGLQLGRKNTIAVDDDMQSNIPMLFAGGDIVRGGATVILAMGDGRRAAAAMHRKLTGAE